MRQPCFWVALCLIGGWVSAGLAHAVTGAAEPVERPPRWIVRYRTGSAAAQAGGADQRFISAGKVNPSAKTAPRAPHGGLSRAQKALGVLSRTRVLDFADDSEATRTLARLRADPNVESVQPSLILHAQGAPNDPSWSSLWGLAKIQCSTAWDSAQGNGVVVAVIDTGVDPTHSDLSSNLWANPGEIPNNNVDDDHNGYIDDDRGWNFVAQTRSPMDGHGHGSHVSGTIAAVGNNGVGVIGVAPAAKIMPLKGLGDDGSGYDADLAEAILYAADNGADVINMSWGGLGDSAIIADAVEYAHAQGVVLVAAAGNSSMDASQFIPAKFAQVITVSATNSSDAVAPFSNTGAKIDVGAPGVGILSTVPGGYYASYNGTSMASPHVAGAAALILSQRPALTNEQVRQVIRAFADDVGAAGFDTQTGYGRLNTARSLLAGTPPTLAITAPTQFGLAGSSVTVTGSASGESMVSRKLQYGVGTSPGSFVDIGTASSAPVNQGVLGVWDTHALAEGIYTLRLAVTVLGGTVYYATISPLRVDHTPPQILSVSLSSGAVLPEADTPVAVTAADTYGIDRCEFSVNGADPAVTRPSGGETLWTASWDWNAPAGLHTLRWTVADKAGNLTTATFPVQVIDDVSPPTVILTSPAEGADISGTISWVAHATDDVGVARVRFYLDGGAALATDDTPPYQGTFSTYGLALGDHRLTAVAEDTSHVTSSHTVTVRVVTHSTPPVIDNRALAVEPGGASVSWTTDEPAIGRVEYGTTPLLGSTSPWADQYNRGQTVVLTSLETSTTFYYRIVSHDDFGNTAVTEVETFVSSEDSAPVVGFVTPPDGATVEGEVTVSGRAAGEAAPQSVDLWVDGRYWATVAGTPAAATVGGATRQERPAARAVASASNTWTYRLFSSQLTDGPHVLLAKTVDNLSQSHDDSVSITVVNGEKVADYDPVGKAPICASPAPSCASGGWLEARSGVALYAEPNAPNTLGGSCADGASGRYHTDESNDWLRISSLDGNNLRAGALAVVEAKVWAYSTKNNYLDLYVTDRPDHPTWIHVATLQPPIEQANILASTFTLPSGGPSQAVRANFRYQGLASPCSAGDYDDHDDLVFAVEGADETGPADSTPTLYESYALPHPIEGNSGTLRVESTGADRVTFSVYAMNGQRVLSTSDVTSSAGPGGRTFYEFTWDTRELAAGAYTWVTELETGGHKTRSAKRIALLR